MLSMVSFILDFVEMKNKLDLTCDFYFVNHKKAMAICLKNKLFIVINITNNKILQKVGDESTVFIFL